MISRSAKVTFPRPGCSPRETTRLKSTSCTTDSSALLCTINLLRESKENVMEREAEVNRFGPRKLLYGLPCAQCRIYYSADLLDCPVCQCRERVPARVIPSVTESSALSPFRIPSRGRQFACRAARTVQFLTLTKDKRPWEGPTLSSACGIRTRVPGGRLRLGCLAILRSWSATLLSA